jgi:hypothetical protein
MFALIFKWCGFVYDTETIRASSARPRRPLAHERGHRARHQPLTGIATELEQARLAAMPAALEHEDGQPVPVVEAGREQEQDVELGAAREVAVPDEKIEFFVPRAPAGGLRR